MKEESISFYKEAINRATAFVEQNLDQSICLDDIANEAHLSTFHFHRIFKGVTGETANEFLMRLRLEKAALLLVTCGNPISDIAFACGFNSIEHFNRTFNNSFGVSPTDYRERKNEIHKKDSGSIRSENKNAIQLAIPEIKNIEPIKVAYIRHTGACDEMGKVWESLIKFGYRKFLVGFKVKMIGIIHDSSEITNEQHICYDACIVVRKEIKPKGDIGYKVINGGKYAIFRYKGTYQKLGGAYNYIYAQWLPNSSFKLADEPAFEMYLNSPQKEKPENLLIDMYIPVK